VALHRFSSADRRAQIFFQPDEGVFKGVVVLPVREIGDVILSDFFRHTTWDFIGRMKNTKQLRRVSGL
jgi:hypothetical protein